MAVPTPSTCHIHVRVESKAFDMGTEIEKMKATLGLGATGALVSFLGLCRDGGGALKALEIEHFPGMAQQEITRIANEAASRFPLQALHIIHRYGLIGIGEEIVLVVAASAHRAEAFAAAEFVMDYLKTQAPFWKKQHRHHPSNPVSSPSDWVSICDSDFERQKRW